MRRLTGPLEVSALILALITLAWGPLAQGSALPWAMNGLTLLGCLTAALTLLALAVRGRPLRGVNGPFVLSGLLLLGWIWLSVLWAPYALEAHRWAGIWTAVIAVALTLHLLADTRARQLTALVAILLTIAAAVAVALLQVRGISVPGFSTVPGVPERFLTGPYFNPSHFSGFLVPASALLSTALLLTRPGLHSLLLLVLLLAVQYANFRTDGATTPVAILAALLPLVVWIWTRSRVAGALLAALTVVGVAGGIYLLATPSGQTQFERYKQFVGVSNSVQAFLDGRLQVHRYGVEMARDHGLRGVGIGQFLYETPRYRAVRLEGDRTVDNRLVNYAHNDTLQMLAETGVPGALLFWVLLLSPVLTRRRNLFGYAALAAVPALAFVGLFDGHLSAIPGTMVFAFGLLALNRTVPAPAQPEPPQIHLEWPENHDQAGQLASR
ncbi:O-antigen ligase [Deinobacterium chartae]|uniref:O-antigen ligase n=1 Tax=Deinobacterium chartae TaxID=521158 RepID=A0A841HY84_9DEIO|nr:O-antigen ligase family protein [Deinobacterium chartae]MBB6097843.1 O-antigen ligase [Deinobacterium chartae]